jgi:hypothetical protein
MSQVGLDSIFSQLQGARGVVSQIAEGVAWNPDLLLVIEYFRLAVEGKKRTSK